MAIPVAIQPFYNVSSGPLDLFTGVLYIMRVLTLGRGSIQPSTEDLGVLEQNIYTPNPVDDSNLWYFEPSSSPGLYIWKSGAFPNASVIWDASEDEPSNDTYNNDEDKSFPLILDNILSENGVSSSDENPLISSLWTLEPHDLSEFGYTGTGYSLKSFNPLHTTGSVTLGSESTKGWWLQVDEENPNNNEARSDHCDNDDKECVRSKSNTIILFEPTSFKLHADTNHLDIGEYSDILKQVRIRKEQLSNKVTLYNPSETEQSFNVSLDTIVEYDVITQPQDEFRMFSSLTIFNPMTNPSMKYFNFEDGLRPEDYNGKDLRLKASSYIKSVEEIDAEPFTTKTVSGSVTYIEEFGGIPYTSWTNVSAQIDTLVKGQDAEGTSPSSRWVKDSALLKHLVRSQGYQGQIREVETSLGEPAKITIKIRGTIRGRLPLPYIQFEEVSTTPYQPSSPAPPLTPEPPRATTDSSRPQSNLKKISVGKKFTSHLSR